MVLFLFTVMFLNIRERDLVFDNVKVAKRITFLFLFLAIVGFFSYRFLSSSAVAFPELTEPEKFGTVGEVGLSLFNDYLLAFELTSVLVVVAMIGVLVVAKGRQP